MAYVLGVHEEMNFAIYGNGHLRGHDVVAGFHVIGRVEPKVILVSFVDLVRMKRTELPVRAWITKIKCPSFCHFWEKVASRSEVGWAPGGNLVGEGSPTKWGRMRAVGRERTNPGDPLQ